MTSRKGVTAAPRPQSVVAVSARSSSLPRGGRDAAARSRYRPLWKSLLLCCFSRPLRFGAAAPHNTRPARSHGVCVCVRRVCVHPVRSGSAHTECACVSGVCVYLSTHAQRAQAALTWDVRVCERGMRAQDLTPSALRQPSHGMCVCVSSVRAYACARPHSTHPVRSAHFNTGCARVCEMGMCASKVWFFWLFTKQTCCEHVS